MDNWNFSLLLEERINEFPYKPAILCVEGFTPYHLPIMSQQTYSQLGERIRQWSRGFRRYGIRKGDRVLFFVSPGQDFLPLTFALFRIGAIPVLIDPGMGRKSLLRSIQSVQARVMIGIPRAQLARILFPSYFRTVELVITLGDRDWYPWKGISSRQLLAFTESDDSVEWVDAEDPAAIIFTTGSTGPAKGVVYTHRMFRTQTQIIQDLFRIQPSDVDMPAFVLFSMFTLCMGCTVVIPKMDPTRPAKAPAKEIVYTIQNCGVTISFGSPAFWKTVGAYCKDHHIQLPSLRAVVLAGAPIPVQLHQLLLDHVLSKQANTFTPYGATEALPVSCFSGDQILKETGQKTREGKGYCVGFPVPGVQVKIIRIRDEVISDMSEVEELKPGEIGEMIVQGDCVSPSYFNLPDKDREHKIRDGSRFWHRMGDVGYQDEQGRIWMCGRKTQRVVRSDGTCFFTVCCEAVFNQHPAVHRSALVGVRMENEVDPVIIIEPYPGRFSWTQQEKIRLRDELLRLGQSYPHTRDIQIILFKPEFPVDIRHNAKIFREKLQLWATKRLRYRKGRVA